MVKNLPAMWETSVWSLGWEDPLEKRIEMHSSVLAGKSHRQRSWVGHDWGTNTLTESSFCTELDLPQGLCTFSSLPGVLSPLPQISMWPLCSSKSQISNVASKARPPWACTYCNTLSLSVFLPCSGFLLPVFHNQTRNSTKYKQQKIEHKKPYEYEVLI